LRVKLEDAYFETHKPDGRIEMVTAGKAEPLLIDLKNPKNKKLLGSAMTNDEIRKEVANNSGLTPAKRIRLRSEITKRYSFSMACLAFAFIAVPLGLGSRRRETSGGLVISLLIGTAYFLITMMAEHFKSDFGAAVMLWTPNAACVVLGILFFRRARFK